MALTMAAAWRSRHRRRPGRAALWSAPMNMPSAMAGGPISAAAAEIEPGVDCPHGSGTHFAVTTRRPKVRWRARNGAPQQEIDWISAPPGLDNVRAPNLTRFLHLGPRACPIAATRTEIETYVNPWAADDPGQPQVTSRIGDGFNLDGKIKASDFVSPGWRKGHRQQSVPCLGLRCAVARQWQCHAGPARQRQDAGRPLHHGHPHLGQQGPDERHDAVVEIGYSPDKIVKDARDGVAVDYSYRILQSAQYTKLKANIKNGVVETEQVEHLHTPRIAWFYDQTGDTNFTKGKIRLTIAPDGCRRHRLDRRLSQLARSLCREHLRPGWRRSRASASMKTMSRFIMRCAAMPTACTSKDRQDMTASRPPIASG